MRKMIFVDPNSPPPSNNSEEENRETLTPNTGMGGSGSKNKKLYILFESPFPEHSYNLFHLMMNCFCKIVDRRKALSIIFSQDHCRRLSLSQISGTPRARFEPAQNLSSAHVE